MPHYINDGGIYSIRWTFNYKAYFYLVFTLCLLIRHQLIAFYAGARWQRGSSLLVGSVLTFGAQCTPAQNPLYGLLSNPVFLEFLISAMVGYLHIWMKKRIMLMSLPLVYTVLSAMILIYIILFLYINNIRALNINSTLVMSGFALTLTLAETYFQRSFLAHLFI
ncbi:MAG: hypothetical protein ACTXOO_00625 [Sodalis sp. (in: enterobacteria)]